MASSSSSSCCKGCSSQGMSLGSAIGDEFTVVSSPSSSAGSSQTCATPLQLSQLTAVHSLMVRGSAGRGGKGKKKKTIGRLFNIAAGRPQPALTSSTQSVTATSEYSASYSTSASAPTFIGLYFVLSNFADSTQYTSLFDQYRFDELEVWIESAVCSSSTVGSALMFSAVDLDDGNNPTAASQVQSKQGCISSETTTGQYHRWKPHMAVAAYSGTFTSYSNAPAGFIDAASPAVQHYGLKIAIPNFDGVVRSLNVTIRGKFTFRAPGI